MTETIDAVIRTLNAITVSGKDNLDYLLGCIRALEELQAKLKAEEAKAHGENDGAL